MVTKTKQANREGGHAVVSSRHRPAPMLPAPPLPAELRIKNLSRCSIVTTTKLAWYK